MNLSAQLIEYAIAIIDRIGYLGVSLILIADNAGLPIPSEAVLALSGAAAKAGTMNILVVIILGVVMQTIGSSLAYYIGYIGGGPLVKKYGKYLLISAHDYEKTHTWFEKNGPKAIFISRIVPVVRTFMGFVAGTAQMPFPSFLWQTFLGTIVWTFIWVGFGFVVGDAWRQYYSMLHYLDYVIILAVLVLVGRFIYRKLERRRARGRSRAAQS
ncbi:MAG: DedA family protein [Candidatus Saccharibacteria bacterium]